MKHSHIFSTFLILSFLYTSCRKDNSAFTKDNGNCNTTVMKLKKMQSTYDDRRYIEAEWNTDGTIKMLNMNAYVNTHKTATYAYENGRIKEAVLNYGDGDYYDTAVFHYNSEGKVDSTYLKNQTTEYGGNMSLTYTNGKLTKLSGYSGTELKFYWVIETDANQNITKGVEYRESPTGFIKENTFTYARDTKKNPFKDLAVYMLHFDDPNNIFGFWGNNNFTTELYEAHTDPIVETELGYKYKYNDNCYPKSNLPTIFGVVLIDEDDFIYTYY